MQEPSSTQGPQPRQLRFLDYIMRGDNWIWTIYVILLCISIVEIFSATSQLTFQGGNASDPAYRHISFLLIGFFALLFFQSVDRRAILAWDKAFYFLGLLFLIALPFLGTDQKGAIRSIGGFQPVEFCKLGVVMLLCSAITARDAFYQQLPVAWYRTRIVGRRFITYLLIIAVVAVPIAIQNLSSALIIGMASLGILFMGKVNGKYLWITIFAFGIAGIIFLSALYGVYRSNHPSGSSNLENIESVTSSSSAESSKGATVVEKLFKRGSTWSERIFGHSGLPLWEEDIHGKKSQEIYSHMAIANSYPFGRFIGNSKMRDFLPEAFSDYIYAIIFEEWGPVGAFLVLLLYLILLGRCYILSRRTDDAYLQLLIVGLPLIIVIQALIHIGVCTGAMFVTGQPLPLLSRGGSSIVGTSISFGLMLAVSRLIQSEQQERLAAAASESDDAEGPVVADEDASRIVEIPVDEGIDQLQETNNE